MSNQNTTHFKTILLTLSFTTLGFVSVTNAASPFAQTDKQTTKLSLKGDTKKCGEGKCGDSMKKSEVKQVKKVTDGKTDIIEEKTQDALPTSEVNTQEEKSEKVDKKCGG